MKNEKLGMRNHEEFSHGGHGGNKMKNEKLKGKKGKVLLLFSFFIILFSFVLSCEQPTGGVKKPKIGYVTLSLAGIETEEGRTIMPPTPSPDDFKVFRLWFIKLTAGGREPLEPFYRTMADLEDPIELEIGEYELEVTAYLDEEDGIPVKPAAHTELKGDNRIVLPKGTGENRYVITLNAIIEDIAIADPEDDDDDEGAQGVFRWMIPCNFNASTGVTVRMQIVSLADNSEKYNELLEDEQGRTSFTGTSFTGRFTLKGELSLPLGYYNVSITLRTTMTYVNLDDGGANPSGIVNKTVVIRDVLHVYKYLESVLNDLLFTDEIFDRNYFTVTYNYNNRTTAPGVKTVAWINPTYKPADPAWAGGLYIFGGWYSDPQLTTPFGFTDIGFNNMAASLVRITENTNLYAKWLRNLETATITLPAVATYTYDGREQIPYYTVSHDGTTLRQGTDFDYVAGGPNRSAGDAEFTITASEGSNCVRSQTKNFSIQKRPVTLSVEKVYDGTVLAAMSAATVAGLVSGDDVTVAALPNTVTATFADKNVGDNKPITITGFTPGNMLSGDDAGNYSLTAGNITGNITRRPVEIIVQNVNYDGTTYYLYGIRLNSSKSYDGDTKATFSISNNSYAFINGITSDNLTVIEGTASFTDKNAGQNKTVTFSGFSIGGTDAGNYTLAAQPRSYTGATITQRGLFVEFPSWRDANNVYHPGVNSKYYDGTTTATYAPETLSRPVVPALRTSLIVAGDQVIFSGPPTYANISVRFATKDVQDYYATDPPTPMSGKRVTIGTEGCSISGADAHNYVLNTTTFDTSSTDPAQSVHIWPPQVTISGISVPSKVYDRQPLTVTGTAVINGKAAGDNNLGVAVQLTYESWDPDWELNWQDIENWRDAGTYIMRFSLTGDSAPNYSMQKPTTYPTVSITPRPVTITATVQPSKVYDGGTRATITSTTLNGAFYEDQYFDGTPILWVRYNYGYGGNDTGGNPAARYDNANVGTGKTVTFNGFSIDGATTNYTLSGQPASVYASITKATPVIPDLVNNRTTPTRIFASSGGRTLGSIPLPSGAAVFGADNDGTFSWNEPNTTVGFYAGLPRYSVTFTPNSGNYNTATGEVTLLVAKQIPMVSVPGGSFMMGNNSGPANERPEYKVNVSSFYMSRYEISEDQFCGVGYYYLDAPSRTGYPCYATTSTAADFCNKLSEMEGLDPFYSRNGRGEVIVNNNANGYRIPTEAEWEYAARGGNGSPDNYTGIYLDNWAWHSGNSGNYLHETGTRAPNSLGLCDMQGNIDELVSNTVYPYWSSEYNDNINGYPYGLVFHDSTNYHITRGGSYRSIADDCTPTRRVEVVVPIGDLVYGTNTPPAGFRVVRNAP